MKEFRKSIAQSFTRINEASLSETYLGVKRFAKLKLLICRQFPRWEPNRALPLALPPFLSEFQHSTAARKISGIHSFNS